MTKFQSILSPSAAVVPGRTIRLEWSAQSAQRGALGRRQFVLEIHCDTAEHANVQAWLEQSGTRRTLLPLQRLKVDVLNDDRLTHIDVVGDNGDGRIAAITLLNDSNATRAIYAQTTLLTKAGFVAGSYDGPVLK